MAVPGRPTPDDLDNISKAFDWLYQWANVLSTGALTVIGGMVWRVSGKIAQFEGQQAQHAADIAELKKMREAQTAKIETLATKDDLKQAADNITGEFRTRLSDMGRFISRGEER